MPESNSPISVADDSRSLVSITIAHATLQKVGDGFLVQQPRLVRSTANPESSLHILTTVAHLHLTPEEARQWMSELADFAYPQAGPVDAELVAAEAAEAEV